MDQAQIEVAYAALVKIKDSVAGIDLAGETEANARLKLIDPILQQVLGWQPGQIKCEVSMDNTRLDYFLVAATGGAIVEAKRPAITFDLEAKAKGKRQYPLNGVVLRSGYTGECISQVKGYAQQHGINLAVATNGLQWVVFLASREDGVAPDKGFAFVFRSIDELSEPDRFREFYELLSKQSVMSQSFKTAGVARGITEQCITEMVERKLLEPYDVSILTAQPQGITSDQLEFVSLSQSGRLHRYFHYAQLYVNHSQLRAVI